MALIGSVDTIKDVAIGSGITTLLLVTTLQSPVLSVFCTVAIPLPTIYYRAKHGRSVGILVPVVALALLVSMQGGLTIHLVYFFELVFCGYVLYELSILRLPVDLTIALTALATLAVGLFIVLVYSSASATDLGQLASIYVRKNLAASIRFYEGMGVPVDTVRPVKDAFEGIHYVLVRIIPALCVSAVLFLAWTSLLLSRPLLKNRRLHAPDPGRLNVWKAPDPLVWSVIGCGLALMIPDQALKLIGLNGLLILMTIYFFQGIAIISFFFNKKRFPRMLRVILYSLIALQQVILLVVVALGFFDIWLNFRKLGAVQNR